MKPGAGPIVQFGSKKTADINADMLTNGLDDGDIAAVVRYDKHFE
jgi:hypothetical protein